MSLSGRNGDGAPNRGSAALVAARHIEEFGLTGLHLKKSRKYDPMSGALAKGTDRFERQVAQTDHFVVPNFPLLEDSAVFLLRGMPRPEAGDVLIELTRSWRIEQVEVIQSGGADAIYAVLCV